MKITINLPSSYLYERIYTPAITLLFSIRDLHDPLFILNKSSFLIKLLYIQVLLNLL